MAILVVGMHTSPFDFNIWLDRGFAFITRFCVPFFFVISSYLLFKSGKSVIFYLKRNLELFVIWYLCYLPFDFSKMLSTDLWVIIQNTILPGYSILWYLSATIVATITFVVIKNLIKQTRMVICFSILPYVFSVLVTSWKPLVELIFSIQLPSFEQVIFRNGITYGLAFVAIGFLLANEDFSMINIRKNIICLMVSLLFLFIESFYLVIFMKTQNTMLFISTLISTYFFCKTIINIPLKLNFGISVLLRKFSTLIFFIHMIFVKICNYIGLSHLISFVSVVILSLIFSYFIIILSNKIKYFKILY